MCCSVSPGVSVRFTDTVLYAAEATGPDGEPVHVLGYQNRVQGGVGLSSLAAGWLPFGRPGNAMILPFPAAPGTMTRANVLDTQDCRDILQDMADAVTATRQSWASDSLSLRATHPPKVQVFRAAG